MARRIVRPTPEMAVRDQPPIDLDAFYAAQRASMALRRHFDGASWITRARALPGERQQLLASLLAKLRTGDHTVVRHLRDLLPDSLPFVAFGLCGPEAELTQTIAEVIASPAYAPTLELVVSSSAPHADTFLAVLWSMFEALAPLPDEVIDHLIAELDRGTPVAARLLSYSHAKPRVVAALVERIEQPAARMGALECLRAAGTKIARLEPLLRQWMRDDDDILATELLARWGDPTAERLMRRFHHDADRL